MLFPPGEQFDVSRLAGLTDRLGVAVGDGVGVGCKQVQLTYCVLLGVEKEKVSFWQGIEYRYTC